jgi:hypothetical protein
LYVVPGALTKPVNWANAPPPPPPPPSVAFPPAPPPPPPQSAILTFTTPVGASQVLAPATLNVLLPGEAIFI